MGEWNATEDDWVYEYEYLNEFFNTTIEAQRGLEYSNYVTVCGNTTFGQTNCTTVYFTVPGWNITFHIYSGETEENLSSVNVYCNNSWSGTIDSGHVEEFDGGDYECTFEKLEPKTYYNETVIFIANNDKTVDVKMSERFYLTTEEHDWIEAIYDCLHTGDCLAMNLLMEINETTTKTWNEFKPTDWSTVDETVTSDVVGPTSNITIDYSINVPKKEGYGLIEGIQGYDDFLPIRLSYWFLDTETQSQCYNQGEYDVAPVEPYCKPVVAYTVGQILTQANFTVEIQPDLPEGQYYIVRGIEIDPDSVWIDYGQGIIGTVTVLEGSGHASANIRSEQPLPAVAEETELQEKSVSEGASLDVTGGKAGAPTGMAAASPFDPSSISVIVSMVTLIVVLFIYHDSRKKRSPWGY